VSRFARHDTPLAGLVALQRQALQDSRGFLSRIFCAEELALVGWSGPIAQINHTLTAQRGSLRGLHFQRSPYAEIKLVSCLRGSVFDVAVDVRAGSPTYLQWHGQVLSADNQTAFLIPAGFAHGFQTLEKNCEMLYCHSAPFHKGSEDGLNALDPALAIAWPLPPAERSERDRQLPLVSSHFQGVVL